MIGSSSFWRSPHRILVPSLMAASIVPIWSAEYFPSQNGPWHLLTIQMLHEYDNPAYSYADFYVPSLHAIPHLAHTLLVYVLAYVFPLLVAHKIAISLYALLLPTSVFWYIATVSPHNVIAGYASFLLIYNVPLFRGYHDYVLGIPLTLLALTHWLRHRHRLTIGRMGVQALLIVAVYLSHVFNFLLLGLAMLIYTLHETRSIRALGRLVLVFAPATLLLVEFAVFSIQQTQWMDASDLLWLPPHAAVEGFFLHFLHTLAPGAYYFAAVPLAFGALLVGWSLKTTYDAAGRQLRRALVATPAIVLLLLCTLLYFTTPHKLYGWHYVNVRFVPYTIVFALASLSVMNGLTRRAVVIASTMAAFVVFGLLTPRMREADRLITEYVSGAVNVRPNSVILPLSFESADVGEISPLAHAADYYHVFRGGANGKGLAQFNTVTPLVYRTYPVTNRFPSWRPDRSMDLRKVSSTYDYVVTWGRDGYAAMLLKGAAFQLKHEQGNLRVFENRLSPSQDIASHE